VRGGDGEPAALQDRPEEEPDDAGTPDGDSGSADPMALLEQRLGATVIDEIDSA